MAQPIGDFTPSVDNIKRPDPSAFSNHASISVTSFDLKAVVDFDASQLDSVITITATAQIDNPEVLILDTKDLDIKSVTTVDGTSVEYVYPYQTCPLGTSLAIKLPSDLKANDTYQVIVTYKTSPQATAAQWMPAEQTHSKKYPYLYTQCQAIHARTLMPCQDTPGVKARYTAQLTVPSELAAVMSATSLGYTTNDNKRIYSFEQQHPIPSYLFAIVVGEIEQAKLEGGRCSIWSEPAQLDICVKEFQQTETFLSTIESFCGPYRWPDYQLINMPGSMAFGGMENVQATFVTPSLLPLDRTTLFKCQCYNGCPGTGKQSNVNVVIHEQAHSWSGNLVTNNTWESFFLNEGITIFIERRTIQKLEGIDHESLHRMIGWEDLKGSVELFKDTPNFTRLVVDLDGDIDPDDCFSSVPYEKGFAMMCYLEQVAGGASVFEPFLKAYFDHFQFKTVDAQSFKAFYLDYMTNTAGVSAEQLSVIDWEKWYREPGMPSVKPSITDTLAVQASSLADIIVEHRGNIPSTVDVTQYDILSWSSSQLTVFLDTLLDKYESDVTDTTIDLTQRHVLWTQILTYIEKTLFDFNLVTNCELIFRWLSLQIRAGIDKDTVVATYDGYQATLGESLTWFLSKIGRMKFVRPLYRDMIKSQAWSVWGEALFTSREPYYHPICATMVRKDFDNSKNVKQVY